MKDNTRTLLLVRDRAQSVEFLSQCEKALGHPLPSVISPILQIERIGVLPNLAEYQTVILSSRNAANVAGDALRGKTVVTVGERTAYAATILGAQASSMGRTMDELCENLSDIEAPAIHLRGVHTRGELGSAASKLGVRVDDAVIYDQVEQKLSNEARQLLLSGDAVIPVFSPRTCQLLAAYPAHKATRVLAISQAATDPWPVKDGILVAKAPDAASMLRLVEEFF